MAKVSRSPETNLSPRTMNVSRPSATDTLIGRCFANVIAHGCWSASLPSDSGIFAWKSAASFAASSWVKMRPPNCCSSALVIADSWIRAVSTLSAAAAGG